MRKRDKVITVAGWGFLAWCIWYDVLQCPGCRREREARGARRARERHNASHRRPATAA